MKKALTLLVLLSLPAWALMNYSLDEPYEGITSNSVIEIVYDSLGIWLGTGGGASYSTDDGLSWRTFRANSGLHSDEVSAVAASYSGAVRRTCIATLHTETQSGQSIPVGNGFSITTDGGATWLPDSVSQPRQATWYGMLSYDLDMHQDDIYSACFYGGLIRSLDGGYNWENLYLNSSDSSDFVDSTYQSYTNRYFSVKVDLSLAPDTISVFAGTAYGLNRFIFTDYVSGAKQNAATQIAFDADDLESSLPGNHVVALGFNGQPGRIYRSMVVGDIAYVAHDIQGLWLVDIGDPEAPAAIGGLNTAGRAFGVFVEGNYAYVADYDRGLQIIDISDPSGPVLSDSINTLGRAVNVYVSGNYAYLAASDAGLQKINIPNLDSITTFEPLRTISDVYIVDSLAYLAAGGDGLVIADIFTTPDSAFLGIYDTPGNAIGVVVAESLAFVADADSGLVVVNISDPANPVLVDRSAVPGSATGVYYAAPNIYVTDKIALRVFQLSTDGADSLIYVGGYDTPGTALDVVIASNHAYIADNYEGLQIVDVSDPGDITPTGTFETVSKEYLWAACRIGAGNAGQRYAVAYSHNYGKTWTTAFEQPAWDFAFIGDTVIVATDDGLYLSDDYQNWSVLREMEDISGERRYYASDFYTVETVGSVIWAGGADGTVRTTDGGENWTVYRSELYADDHFAYPSPFSPMASTRKGTTIHYMPPQTTEVTIKIYDFNLDLVRTLVDGATRTGGVEADNDVWFGKNDKGEFVANGVYFYNIKLGTGEDWWGKVAVVK